MSSSLRWKPPQDEEIEWAVCGDLIVGFIGLRNDGLWFWNIDAVFMRWIGEGSGETESRKTAKAALELNWQSWLDHSKLAPMPVIPRGDTMDAFLAEEDLTEQVVASDSCLLKLTTAK